MSNGVYRSTGGAAAGTCLTQYNDLINALIADYGIKLLTGVKLIYL